MFKLTGPVLLRNDRQRSAEISSTPFPFALPTAHLTHDLDVRDFEPGPRGTGRPSWWGIRPRFRLVSEDRQDKIPRFAEALPHQESPRGGFGLEK